MQPFHWKLLLRFRSTPYVKPSGNASTTYGYMQLRESGATVNERIYTTVNNGVYRSGFATGQEAYEEACTGVFETLDAMEVQCVPKPESAP